MFEPGARIRIRVCRSHVSASCASCSKLNYNFATPALTTATYQEYEESVTNKSILSHVRRIDVQLDRICLVPRNIQGLDEDSAQDALEAVLSRRVNKLLGLIKNLSTAASSRPLLPSRTVQSLILQSGLADFETPREVRQLANKYETELEWMLVSKAAVQTYGLVIGTLLDQMITLSNDIWYWDEVLGSYMYSSLYTVQTSPSRFWHWSKDIYMGSNRRLSQLRNRSHGGSDSDQDEDEAYAEPSQVNPPTRFITDRWQKLYNIVRESIAERSVADLQCRVMSPVARCRSQARKKQSTIKNLREMTACGLGVLIDEAFCFGTSSASQSEEDAKAELEWESVTEKSVALMDMVLKEGLNLDHTLRGFEDKIFEGVEDDPELSIHLEETSKAHQSAILARRLIHILGTRLPDYVSAARSIARENGRPSRLVRYWLPAGALLVSSTGLLRIISERKEDLIQCIADFGGTLRDFWVNWVVVPVRNVIGTIRHDVNSEIAIMSRDSLQADRDSLERMVVDFALDKPSVAVGQASISDSQIADIRSRVREGDVTPVLKVYEQDLKSPLVGAVRGDLVRSLLIQVQKTKVDLEVALDGIDALLKSQELVFGFVGLTPGLLVSMGMWQYLRRILDERKGTGRAKSAGRSIRVLRNIDRIFAEASPTQNNILDYKDHGLLIGEAHVLRQLVQGILPRDIEKEFLEDVEGLTNLKGVQAQARALERIRWAYSRWLH